MPIIPHQPNSAEYFTFITVHCAAIIIHNWIYRYSTLPPAPYRHRIQSRMSFLWNPLLLRSFSVLSPTLLRVGWRHSPVWKYLMWSGQILPVCGRHHAWLSNNLMTREMMWHCFWAGTPAHQHQCVSFWSPVYVRCLPAQLLQELLLLESIMQLAQPVRNPYMALYCKGRRWDRGRKGGRDGASSAARQAGACTFQTSHILPATLLHPFYKLLGVALRCQAVLYF